MKDSNGVPLAVLVFVLVIFMAALLYQLQYLGGNVPKWNETQRLNFNLV